MSNLSQRIITALAGIACIMGALLWNDYSFILLFLLLNIITHIEYLNTVQSLKDGKKSLIEHALNIAIGIFIFFFFLTAAYDILFAVHLSLYAFSIIGFLFIYELFQKRNNPFHHIGLNILGIVYICVPYGLIIFIGTDLTSHQRYPYLVLSLLLLIWSNDVFSFFTGRWLGRHKLYERISPKKTWEGFIGGCFATILCSVILSYSFERLNLIEWIGWAIVVCVSGTLGDLTESKLKRSLQIKDSATILPGHGGFLDRFDALLMATPFSCAYLALTQNLQW